MKKKIFALFTALLCVVLLAQTASAAQVSAKIPVKITLAGTLPSTPEKFEIKLVADDASYPMPVGSENGEYTLVIRGAAERSFTIPFDSVGIFEYTIYQQKGENKKCTYDVAEYRVKIYVTNAEDGGLEVTVLIHDKAGEKVPGCDFHNKYKVEPNDTPKTDDESNFPLYITLAAGSVLVLLALFLTRERQEKLEELVEFEEQM